ncbi:MAG: hypothetical protein AAF639_18210 [Chloroflexota bacterium]
MNIPETIYDQTTPEENVKNNELKLTDEYQLNEEDDLTTDEKHQLQEDIEQLESLNVDPTPHIVITRNAKRLTKDLQEAGLLPKKKTSAANKPVTSSKKLAKELRKLTIDMADIAFSTITTPDPMTFINLPEPHTYHEVLQRPDRPFWIGGMKNEYGNMKDKEVWIVQQTGGQRFSTSRWSRLPPFIRASMC